MFFAAIESYLLAVCLRYPASLVLCFEKACLLIDGWEGLTFWSDFVGCAAVWARQDEPLASDSLDCLSVLLPTSTRVLRGCIVGGCWWIVHI